MHMRPVISEVSIALKQKNNRKLSLNSLWFYDSVSFCVCLSSWYPLIVLLNQALDQTVLLCPVESHCFPQSQSSEDMACQTRTFYCGFSNSFHFNEILTSYVISVCINSKLRLDISWFYIEWMNECLLFCDKLAI